MTGKLTNWTEWDAEMKEAGIVPEVKPEPKRWKEPTAEEMATRKARWEREAREPTPLPWRVVRGLQWNDTDELIAIEGANEDTVADNAEFYPHAIKAADAEFIVQRVNAHDALVKAASEVIEYLERHGPSIVPHLMDSDQNPGQRLRDALALARGGK